MPIAEAGLTGIALWAMGALGLLFATSARAADTGAMRSVYQNQMLLAIHQTIYKNCPQLYPATITAEKLRSATEKNQATAQALYVKQVQTEKRRAPTKQELTMFANMMQGAKDGGEGMVAPNFKDRTSCANPKIARIISHTPLPPLP